MVPLVAGSNIQAPTPLASSVFSGQVSDPQVGRLPLKTVPAAINSSKVSDQSRNQQQLGDNTPEQEIAAAASSAASSQTSSLAGQIKLESPLSTPFIAQLFAQLQTSSGLIGALSGEGTGVPSGFVDFDRLAEFGKVKYKPSNASAPRSKPAQQEAIEAFVAQDAAPKPEPRAQAEALVRDVSERLTVFRTPPVTAVDSAPATPVEAVDAAPAARTEPEGNPIAEAPQARGSFKSLVEAVASAAQSAYTTTQNRVSETLAADRSGGNNASAVSLLL